MIPRNPNAVLGTTSVQQCIISAVRILFIDATTRKFLAFGSAKIIDSQQTFNQPIIYIISCSSKKSLH